MEIEKVGVLGCGLMGHGITQICAQAGWDVVVREVDQDRLDAGIGKIEKQLARSVEKGKLEQADADAIRARINATLDYADLADCDLVIEAITEDLDAKLAMWKEVDGIVKEGAAFATNTSSLAVADQAAATSRPERFLGLHFFNPAQVMPLLEVVRAENTGDEAVELAPHRELPIEILGDRLDHQVAVGQVGVVERPLDTAANPIGVGLLHLPLLDRARQLLLDLAHAGVELLLRYLADDDVPAGLCADLGDPVPHQAAADYSYLLDLHPRAPPSRFGTGAGYTRRGAAPAGT